MLCKLHSVYNTLHTLCDITQKVSNHYTVEGQFFAFNLEKNYTGQKIFTQTPSVASVTNIGYGLSCVPFSWRIALLSAFLQTLCTKVFSRVPAVYAENRTGYNRSEMLFANSAGAKHSRAVVQEEEDPSL